MGNVHNRIRLRPTLPIRGGEVIVKIGTLTNDARLPQCEITLKAGDEHNWTDLSVQVSCDNTNKAFAPSALTFTAFGSTGALSNFWGFYEPSPVVVR